MTKLNKEVIEAISAELKVIGQANLKLAEYFNTLGEDAPTIEAVLDEKKSPAKKSKVEIEVEEDAAEEEVQGNVIEVDGEEMDLDAMTVPQLKKLAGEFEIKVPAKGKDKIIAAILEGLSDFEEEEDEEEAEEADVEVEEVEEIEDTEEEADEEEEEEEEDEEEEEEIDLDSMGKEELLELAEELEIEVPKKKKTEKASAYLTKLRELLAEALEEDEEEVEEDEVEEDEEEEEDEAPDTVIETEDGEVDLAEMSLKELKAFAKDYELEITEKKKDGIIAEILEQLSDDEEEEDEDGVEDTEEEAVDLAEEYGLNDMEQEELAEILEEHGLSVKGKKQALVDRVLKAIEDGTIELEEEGE